ncbi:hypothetical protein THAOC_24205, partial [Thalassiosira oceanica]
MPLNAAQIHGEKDTSVRDIDKPPIPGRGPGLPGRVARLSRLSTLLSMEGPERPPHKGRGDGQLGRPGAWPKRPTDRVRTRRGALAITAASATMAASCIPAVAADVCANCGREGGDGVKLKNCTACLLVKYCGVDCQKAHRKIHKKACKERAAELKDERLYGQGHERPRGRFCPICAQPVPLPTEEHACVSPCCMKMVCKGCVLAAMKMGINDKCEFCRTPRYKGDAEALARIQARVGKKDPEAIRHLGYQYMGGRLGLEKNMTRAVELWTEAAELGSAGAFQSLGTAYSNGDGVEKDTKRGASFYEKAAMLGNSTARHNLGCYECERGRYDRGVRHLLISAKMGQAISIENIKMLFKGGLATKSQYAEALKGYQAAVEEMKSPDRKEAETSPFFHQSGKNSPNGLPYKSLKECTEKPAPHAVQLDHGPPDGAPVRLVPRPFRRAGDVHESRPAEEHPGDVVPQRSQNAPPLASAPGSAIGRAARAPTPTSIRTSSAGPTDDAPPRGGRADGPGSPDREVDLDETPREREARGQEEPGAGRGPIPLRRRPLLPPHVEGDARRRHREPLRRVSRPKPTATAPRSARSADSRRSSG